MCLKWLFGNDGEDEYESNLVKEKTVGEPVVVVQPDATHDVHQTSRERRHSAGSVAPSTIVSDQAHSFYGSVDLVGTNSSPTIHSLDDTKVLEPDRGDTISQQDKPKEDTSLIANRYVELVLEIQNLRKTTNKVNIKQKEQGIKNLEMKIFDLEKTNDVKRQQVETAKHDLSYDEQSVLVTYFEPVVNVVPELNAQQKKFLKVQSEEQVLTLQLVNLKRRLDKAQLAIQRMKDTMKELIELCVEQDQLLANIFDDLYGSVLEHTLDNEMTKFMKKNNSVLAVYQRWCNMYKLVKHAEKQLKTGLRHWETICEADIKGRDLLYIEATATRENFVNAALNLEECNYYMSDYPIPYCTKTEVDLLYVALANIYTDMLTVGRQQHARQCYQGLHDKCLDLKTWLSKVTKTAIKPDLREAAINLMTAEHKLHAERLRLLREKGATLPRHHRDIDRLDIAEKDIYDRKMLKFVNIFMDWSSEEESDEEEPTEDLTQDLTPSLDSVSLQKQPVSDWQAAETDKKELEKEVIRTIGKTKRGRTKMPKGSVSEMVRSISAASFENSSVIDILKRDQQLQLEEYQKKQQSNMERAQNAKKTPKEKVAAGKKEKNKENKQGQKQRRRSILQ